MVSIKAWKKIPSVVPWSMLVILAVVNALLIRQNVQMRAKLEQFMPKALQSGDKVPPFSVSGLRGESINVDYTGEMKQVLLYFTPS